MKYFYLEHTGYVILAILMKNYGQFIQIAIHSKVNPQL